MVRGLFLLIYHHLQVRMWQRDVGDRTALQPTPAAVLDVSNLIFPIIWNFNCIGN